MITAIIQSITSRDTNILVAVQFSNTDYPKTYTFGMNDTQDTINTTIQSDLDNKNGIDLQLSNLQPLIGTTLQTDPNTITAMQTTLSLQNAGALNAKP